MSRVHWHTAGQNCNFKYVYRRFSIRLPHSFLKCFYCRTAERSRSGAPGVAKSHFPLRLPLLSMWRKEYSTKSAHVSIVISHYNAVMVPICLAYFGTCSIRMSSLCRWLAFSAGWASCLCRKVLKGWDIKPWAHLYRCCQTCIQVEGLRGYVNGVVTQFREKTAASPFFIDHHTMRPL